jgi:hypothetical protein
MKIYKFKDLSVIKNHPHFFQILFENKIWCASPESLNDSEEFCFKMDYRPSEHTEHLLTKIMEKFGKAGFSPEMAAAHTLRDNKLEAFSNPIVKGLIDECRSTIGVTSFTSVGMGEQLWENYGGSGNGAVVEFEISDSLLGDTFHPVGYVPERIFHVDVFLKSQVTDARPIFRNILCTKTLSWSPEKEIRFLGKTPNVNFTLDSPITNVTLGSLVSDDIVNQVISHCEKRGINIIRA